MFKDKNTVAGFVLLGLLFFGFFTYTSMQQKKLRAKTEAKAAADQRIKDSTQKANARVLTAADTLKLFQDSINNQKVNTQKNAGSFARFTNGAERIDTVSNGVISMQFSNKGGKPAKIWLTSHKDFNGKPVQLLGDSADKFGYSISPGTDKAISSDNLYFETQGVTKNADGSFSIKYQLKDSAARGLTHTYTIKPGSYLFDCTIDLTGASQLVTQNTLSLTRQTMVHQQDNDISFERQSSTMAYLKDGSFGSIGASGSNDKDFSVPVQWISYKQRFFNSTLFYKAGMKDVKIECVKQPDSAHQLYLATSNMKIPVTGENAQINLQFYTGPNDYNILNGIGQKTRNLVQLHSSPVGFVKWINRWLFLPVFDFLLKNVGSVGLAIALLTIFIRLLTSPLMYPGYLTGAKMKALRPELAKLKEKFPDKQEYAMEQMKFMRQAGVNTFAGCLPGLLQIPIFFSLYALFTSHIGIRDQAFWWVNDLSKYDEFIKFGFHIPLLGSHMGLFTLLACITSFLISWYGMTSATPDQDNPVLKYLPYIFPVVMIFIFNSLPSALNWYYTVSNIVTLLLQFVIQRYIINHDKILVKIDENRKRIKPKSKFAERYEQMMEAQRKAQELKNKTTRK
jgi:YidC/Oxa1 family membrane protein insertase